MSSSFEGVDLEGVKTELQQFVTQTKPVNQSSGNFITATSGAACGRSRALELSERVLPILSALYPSWKDENEEHGNFEFGAIRDAAQRLIARIDSHGEVNALIAGHDASPRLSGSQLHELVWRAASAQWATGHRQEAVLAASKAVNSMLQDRLDRRDVSGGQVGPRGILGSRQRLLAGPGCASQESRTIRLGSRCVKVS